MHFIVQELLAPLSRRVGTAIAGMVGTLQLLNPGQLDQLEASITVIAALAVDLVLSGINRKNEGR